MALLGLPAWQPRNGSIVLYLAVLQPAALQTSNTLNMRHAIYLLPEWQFATELCLAHAQHKMHILIITTTPVFNRPSLPFLPISLTSL